MVTAQSFGGVVSGRQGLGAASHHTSQHSATAPAWARTTPPASTPQAPLQPLCLSLPALPNRRPALPSTVSARSPNHSHATICSTPQIQLIMVLTSGFVVVGGLS
jgi:hypothetical protein